MTEPPSTPEEPKALPGAAAFLGMGLSAASCVAVGVGLGVWADRSWHTAPALLMVGLATGVATAVLTVVKQIRNFL